MPKLDLSSKCRPITRRRAKKMRENPTKAEARLWDQLRNRQVDGWVFKPQVVIRGWIADFYCAKGRLVVEVDGSSHAKRGEKDAFRDATILKLGIKTLRVTNEEVFKKMPKVLTLIREALEEV